MKVSELTRDNINFVDKACDNGLLNCESCQYKLSKCYSSKYREYGCVCDLKYVTFDDFENIEEFRNFLNEVRNEEIGDIK